QKRKNLTTDERSAALQDLLARSNNGVPRRGAAGEVGEKYGNSRRAMLNLWKRYAEQKSAGVAVPDVSCRRRGSARDLTQQKEALQSMPLKQRTTQRSVAAAIDLPKTTFRRRMKDLGVKSHTRFLKPLLSNAHKLKRLRWARSFAGTTTGGIRRFKGMGNVVHVDEKWWYICKDKQRYYVFDGETPPTRKLQSKSHIMKVMFLGVVGRPRRNTAQNTELNGKIGIYPFTEQVRAQRRGVNRAAGTIVTKNVEVTKERYKTMMIDHVIPGIKSQFPRPLASASPNDRIIWVQQDNARPHNINDDPELRAAMSSDGWDIRMINQPANSPDTNVLDLGFFRSVQSLQDRTTPRNIGDLVKAVKDAWNDDPPDVLNRVWLSLQACLEQIMLAGGDNDYKISHLRKGRLQDAGTLPWSLECSEEAWVKGAAALAELE
ncbi:unnamed protein product, partial [Ascophyllum nodosum]